MECTGSCPSWCRDFAGTRPQCRHRPGGRSEAEDPRPARVDGARTCDTMSRHCGGRVVGGMSAARRRREAARRTGRCGRVVGMVGDVEADRVRGDHARVPITLLGIGAMEVVVGGREDGGTGRPRVPWRAAGVSARCGRSRPAGACTAPPGRSRPRGPSRACGSADHTYGDISISVIMVTAGLWRVEELRPRDCWISGPQPFP